MRSVVTSKENWSNNMKYLIPGTIQYTRAYIIKYKESLVENIKDLVAIFERTSDIHIDDSSFALMNTMLVTFPSTTLKPHFSTIFTCIFKRLQAEKATRSRGSTQLSRGLLYFLSLFINLYRVDTLLACTEQIQPGIFIMLLNSEAGKISLMEGRKHRREVISAFCRLLLEIELTPAVFCTMLEGLIKLVELEGRRNFAVWEEDVGDDNMQRMKHQQLFNATIEVHSSITP
jgi:hypothetical protein